MYSKKTIQLLTLTLGLALSLMIGACGSSSGTAASSPAETASGETLAEEVASNSVGTVSTILDQYYANDKFMIEMLVNDDIIIEEQDSSLMFSTPEQHVGIVISIIPGIQNLSAAGELAKNTVTSALEGVTTGEIEDATLFGARAKLIEYAVDNDEEPFRGIQAAAIINQSCYFMNFMIYDDTSEAESKLMVDMFSGMNVLTPESVDQNTQTAVYTSKYETELKTEAVKPAKNTKTKTVTEWVYLPYEFYSWWGYSSDYYDGFPSYYFQPDWDYYSDPGDYWSWGWGDDYDWGFYDSYGDFYDWDTYQEYQDYYDDWDGGGGYGDDYAEYYDWALEPDYYDGYDPYSDPGDYYDDGYSDPGDYYDDGYDEWYDEGAWNDNEYYEDNDYDW